MSTSHIPTHTQKKPQTNVKTALRDQEQCITSKVNTLAGSNDCGKSLKEKLLAGGRASTGAVSFLHNNEDIIARLLKSAALTFLESATVWRTQHYYVKVRHLDYVPHLY